MVYSHNGACIKVASDFYDFELIQNRKEFDIFNTIPLTLKSNIAEIYSISSDDSILVTKLHTTFYKGESNKETIQTPKFKKFSNYSDIQKTVEYMCSKHKLCYEDLQYTNNYGYIGNRLVLIDYGLDTETNIRMAKLS